MLGYHPCSTGFLTCARDPGGGQCQAGRLTGAVASERVSEALNHTHHMARQERLELPTYCLEGSCSIQLSYWRIFMERVMGIEPTRPAWKAGILPLNYTRMTLSR